MKSEQVIIPSFKVDGSISEQPDHPMREILDAFEKKNKSFFKTRQQKLFDVLLNSLKDRPEVTCRIVRGCDEVGLAATDLTELNSEQQTIFNFLTQPITDQNQAVIMSCAEQLFKGDKPLLEALELSINATFAFVSARYHESPKKDVYKNLRGANLRNVQQKGIIRGRLNFRGANLREAIFERTDRDSGSFLEANFEGARFLFTECISVNLTKAIFKNAYIESSTFNLSNLTEANFEGATIHGTKIFKVSFVSSNISQASFLKADCNNLKLDRVAMMEMGRKKHDNIEELFPSKFKEYLQQDPLAFSFLLFGSNIGYEIDYLSRKFSKGVIVLGAVLLLPLFIPTVIAFWLLPKYRDYFDAVPFTAFDVIQLKKMAQECLERVLEDISFDNFCLIMNLVFKKNNIFSYQRFGTSVKNTYPEAVQLIAEAYIRLSTEQSEFSETDGFKKQEIKNKIIQELKEVNRWSSNHLINESSNIESKSQSRIQLINEGQQRLAEDIKNAFESRPCAENEQFQAIIVIKTLIDNNIFSINDLLNCRSTCRTLRQKVEKSPIFQQYVFITAVLYTDRPRFPLDSFIDLLKPSKPFLVGVLEVHRQIRKPYFVKNQKAFFDLLMTSFLYPPEATCRMVQVCYRVGLVVRDLKQLSDVQKTIFEFLTGSIEDTSEKNENNIMDCVPRLGLEHKKSEALEISIRATFAFLRGEYGEFSTLDAYKNLRAISFKSVSFPEHINLRGANLRNAKFGMTKLKYANLSHALFFETDFIQVDLEQANLAKVYFVDSLLFDVRLKGAKFQGAVIIEPRITRRVIGRDMEEAVFDKAYIKGVLLTGKLKNASFKDACLDNTQLNFGGADNVCDLHEINFFNAYMDNCRIWRSGEIKGFSLLEPFTYPAIQVLLPALKNSITRYPLNIAFLIFSPNIFEVYKEYPAGWKEFKELAQECLKKVLEDISFDNFCLITNLVFRKNNIFTYESFWGLVKNTYPQAVGLIAEAYVNLSNQKWKFTERGSSRENEIKNKIIAELIELKILFGHEYDVLIKNLENAQPISRVQVIKEDQKRPVDEAGNLVDLNGANNNNNIPLVAGSVSAAPEARDNTQFQLVDENGNALPSKTAIEKKSPRCCALSFWTNPNGLQKFGIAGGIFSGAVLASSGIVSLTRLKAITVGAVLGKSIALSAGMGAMTVPYALLTLGAVLLATAVFIYAVGSIAKCCAKPQIIHSIN